MSHEEQRTPAIVFVERRVQLLLRHCPELQAVAPYVRQSLEDAVAEGRIGMLEELSDAPETRRLPALELVIQFMKRELVKRKATLADLKAETPTKSSEPVD